MFKGALKDKVVGLLGEEEYSIIAELLNGQLEQMEECLEVAGIEYQEQQKFNSEELEKAMDKAEIDQVIEITAKQFNKRMKSLQVEILKDKGLSNPEIVEQFKE